jgi:hypothetical protein
MISHGTRRHAKFFNSLGKRLNLNGAVQEAVVGVEMEVGKSLIRHISKEELAACLAAGKKVLSLTDFSESNYSMLISFVTLTAVSSFKFQVSSSSSGFRVLGLFELET